MRANRQGQSGGKSQSKTEHDRTVHTLPLGRITARNLGQLSRHAAAIRISSSSVVAMDEAAMQVINWDTFRHVSVAE